MRIVGGFSVATGILMGLMVAFPYRHGEVWARWAIPSVGLFHWAVLLYVTAKLAYLSSVWTPWPLCLGMVGILLIGIFFSRQNPAGFVGK
jgi:hypothetical protein